MVCKSAGAGAAAAAAARVAKAAAAAAQMALKSARLCSYLRVANALARHGCSAPVVIMDVGLQKMRGLGAEVATPLRISGNVRDICRPSSSDGLFQVGMYVHHLTKWLQLQPTPTAPSSYDVTALMRESAALRPRDVDVVCRSDSAASADTATPISPSRTLASMSTSEADSTELGPLTSTLPPLEPPGTAASMAAAGSSASARRCTDEDGGAHGSACMGAGVHTAAGGPVQPAACPVGAGQPAPRSSAHGTAGLDFISPDSPATPPMGLPNPWLQWHAVSGARAAGFAAQMHTGLPPNRTTELIALQCRGAVFPGTVVPLFDVPLSVAAASFPATLRHRQQQLAHDAEDLAHKELKRVAEDAMAEDEKSSRQQKQRSKRQKKGKSAVDLHYMA